MSTRSPAASSPSPRGTSASAAAPSIEVRRCDCCGPVGLARQPPASARRRTRTACSRSGLSLDGRVEQRAAAGRLGIGADQRAQRGQREELEGDHRRHGVAGEPEDERPLAHAEPGRLAGLERDTPEALLGAELGERVLHVVVRPHRNAARDADHVGRAERPARAPPGWPRRCRPRAREAPPPRPPARPARAARGRSTRRSGPARAARRAPPARRRSRAARPAACCGQVTEARPERGEHAHLGRADLGARDEHLLARPHVLAGAPDVGARARCPARATRPSAAASVRSTGTTASAPAGTGAPVEMRTAVPGSSRPANGCPARASPTTGSSAAGPATSA